MSITPQLSTVGGVAIAHAQLLVLGGGVTGRSVAQVLSNMGAEVSIYDESESSNFEFSRVTVDELSRINWAAAVVSPGWRPSHPVIADLRNREIPLLNEIDLAWEIKQQVAPEQKWLAVTGTNGKTTTVELTESILKLNALSALTRLDNSAATALVRFDISESIALIRLLISLLNAFDTTLILLNRFALALTRSALVTDTC